MRTLTLENKNLRVSILLDKGSDVFELIYKPLDLDLMWHSPTGYRNPTTHIQDVSSSADVFHDFYGGGWNDIFPNYGNPSTHRGANFVGHAESALLPWTCSEYSHESGVGSAKLSVECVRYPIRAEKKISIHPEEPILSISEDLINLGEQEVEVSWAQHIAYGEPFVGPELEIDIPATTAKSSALNVPHSRLVARKEFQWPNGPGLDGSTVDLRRIPKNEHVQEDFPIVGMKSPQYRLYNPELNLGVQVDWSEQAFPVLWYWLYWGVLDYPFYGKGRTIALEPTTSSTGNGLADDVLDGSAKMIRQNSTLHADLSLKLLTKH